MAITFSVLNAALLWWRIRIENEVLTERIGTT
jgi:isoprenylcysteine carboxyl methyltransferase (ICMT) family protein YpbQ